MVASVVIRALIRSFATTHPLTNPETAPQPRPASTPIVMLPVLFITRAATTPAHATTELIDKSKPPAARQNSMVHATIPVIDTARASPFMFATERKFSTPREQPTK